MLDKKTFTIGILSLCAVVLTAANLLQPQQADAAFVVKDRDYTAVTARVNKGGEGLYIVDNQTGAMVALTFEPGKGIVPMGQPQPLMNAFKK